MKSHAHPNYMAVFAILFIMTVIEVAVAFTPLPKVTIVLALVCLAVIKASLVALYYMHLKFEGRLIYAVALVPIFMAVLLTLTLLNDTAYLY